ncbi:MAG TPA: O-antigen ligase family protein [Actinophytocola sp.]|uniref:O-antigen ligase family protein n=1 Tax=Actinophytocola sp. TaxID=1872138 RepID=UPI002E051177|nr:O-antigen ligase family protein [Actinophytocola sp.]
MAISAARRLRAASILLEVALGVVIAGSVAAIGSVHPWAYWPLWYACAGIAALLVYRALAIRRLRRLIGRQRFAFHPSGRWLVLDSPAEYGRTDWSFDLERPLLPPGPLLLPGVVFLTLVIAQLVPLPPGWATALNAGRGVISVAESGAWAPITVDAESTLRGAAFLVAALLLHVGAVAALDRGEARRRFQSFVALLGLALALVALGQVAVNARLIYGIFAPIESETFFGPFVNRNHFAGYMLLVAPMALAVLARSHRHYQWRVGARPNSRRRLVALASPEGAGLMLAVVPALASISALVASTSRGGILAFVLGLVLAGIGLRRQRGVSPWLFAVALGLMAITWFGLGRLEVRFRASAADSAGRTVVWRESLGMLRRAWLTGYGFNTFGLATSRATPWRLPVGATPGSSAIAEAARVEAMIGYRTPSQIPAIVWYREAHDDYVQVAVECGAAGLIVAVWAAVRVLKAARLEPWVMAALAGVLLHVVVDFDLQIPAITVLFVCIAGLCQEGGASGRIAIRHTSSTGIAGICRSKSTKACISTAATAARSQGSRRTAPRAATAAHSAMARPGIPVSTSVWT